MKWVLIGPEPVRKHRRRLIQIHPWKSSGEKRTISWYYEPDDLLLAYLRDMQEAIKYSLVEASRYAIREGRMPSPIQLRREIKGWFYTKYDYARHHINPVCRAAVAILRSHRKNNHGEVRIPEVKKLAMRIDGELMKVVDSRVRVTLQPKKYTWIAMNTKNKHFLGYSSGRPAELLITDRKVCLTFAVGIANKALGLELVASDLNFATVDSTVARLETDGTKLEQVNTKTIATIVRIQNDFSRRRRAIQLHVNNRQKREKKLRQTRGRQMNRWDARRR